MTIDKRVLYGSADGKLTYDKDEAIARDRATYDARVVEEAVRAEKLARLGKASPRFRLKAPDMPRRAVPASSEMKPKPPTTPF